MPGIFGLHGIEKDTAAQLASMANAMRLESSYVEDQQFVDGRFAASRMHLGSVGDKTAPEVHGSGLYAWVEGEAYNLKDAKRVLRSRTPDYEGENFGRLLLVAYEAGILDDFLAQIDGQFSAVIYDARKQKISLITDRYGMQMLYWHSNNGLFAWSSEVKAILALRGVNKALCETSLPCFMELGYLLGETTWFEHIRLTKPASILEYDLSSGRSSHRFYWKWSCIEPSNITFEDAVEQLGQKFIAAVKSRFSLDEKIGVSLSGGLDSRALLAAVTHIHPDYRGYAYTFGVPNCEDIRIAQQVVAKTDWEHELFYFYSKNWLESRYPKVWDTDGMLSMMHMHNSEFLERIKSKMAINLNGYLGDVVCGGGWLNSIPCDVRATEQNVSVFFNEHGGLTGINDSFYNTEHVEPILYMNRARRFTNMGSVGALTHIAQRKPFFDNDLIEFVFSLPENYRKSNKLYAAMLTKTFPNFFLDIPWQKTGKPVTALNGSIPSRVLSKTKRLIWKSLGQKDKKIDSYADYDNWIRQPDVSELLIDILKFKGSHYGKITEEDYYETFLKPHLAESDSSYSEMILRAATVELYLKRVFD